MARNIDHGFRAMDRLARLAEATGVIPDRNNVRSIRMDTPANGPMLVTIEVYPTDAFLEAIANLPLPPPQTEAEEK